MPSVLSIYVNGNKVLDYENNYREPGLLLRRLDEMDIDMNEGIEINGEMIDSPNKQQRAHYITLSLLYSIENANEGMISATCSYLANRLPELKQIRATEADQEVTLDFIFDEVN